MWARTSPSAAWIYFFPSSFYYVQLWFLVSTFLRSIHTYGFGLLRALWQHWSLLGLFVWHIHTLAAAGDFTAAYTPLGRVSVRETPTEKRTNDEGKKDQRFPYMKIQLAYISFIVLREKERKNSRRRFYRSCTCVHYLRDETISRIENKKNDLHMACNQNTSRTFFGLFI